MGRNKTPKSNEAIEVPKDGPMSWFLEQKRDGKISKADAVGVGEGLAVLFIADSGSDSLEGDEASPSIDLWRVLTNTDQIRQQLQALQAYRSRILHLLKSTSEIGDEQEFVGTYRLLLEWSLSADIPTPLRRAIGSNLETLNSILGVRAHGIREQVISSLVDDEECWWWSNPLVTLFEMLSYEPMRCLIVEDIETSVKVSHLLVREAEALRHILEEHSFYNDARGEGPGFATSQADVAAMGKCILIANTFKLFLTAGVSSTTESHLSQSVETLLQFLWMALSCRAMPADALHVVGIAYGHALVFCWKFGCESDDLPSVVADRACAKVVAITSNALLPRLNQVAAVQGIAATLPKDALVSQSPPIYSEPMAVFLLEQCRVATGTSVRLSALRGLHTLINRCLGVMVTASFEQNQLCYLRQIADSTLEVVLQSWESPPGRQVATAVPGLFRSLLALIQKVDGFSGGESPGLNTLVQRILNLPSNRKGKYLALESLLPAVGAKYVIDVSGTGLIASLIGGIGDGGYNAVAKADLLGELLSRLRLEMNEDAGLVVTRVNLNRNERRKFEKERLALRESVDCEASPLTRELPFLSDWVSLWAPHLAFALVTGSMSSRKHIAARGIPLLVQIIGGTSRRHDAAFAFAFLLDELDKIRNTPTIAGDLFDSYKYGGETETLSDRILWATFEIAKQASILDLLKLPCAQTSLADVVARHIPKRILEVSLTHSLPSTRLAAFASIEAVIPTYLPRDSPPMVILEEETRYWRRTLPYSFKAESREYTKELLLILSSLLNRLSDMESAYYEATPNASATTASGNLLPMLTSFVCDFLISDVIILQGAYLGSVPDKEKFVLSLLECILSFASQDDASSTFAYSRTKRTRSRSNPRKSEVATMRHVWAVVVSDELMCTLYSLLFSVWDNIRAEAYATLCWLIEDSRARGFQPSMRLSSNDSIQCIRARSIYLASSPRQREADTGSRILALSGILRMTRDERTVHVESLMVLLVERLDRMTSILGLVASTTPGDYLLDHGSKMPMAHGIMMALRLILENRTTAPEKNDTFHERFVSVCRRALELSLSVVADLKATAPSVDQEDASSQRERDYMPPLNVNTGAIGANAAYSSIQRVDKNTTRRRFALQRVIIGSWLLTKEACASLASVVTCGGFHPSFSLVKSVGSLLISMLTTVKHQGAAFSAHRALQDIANFCFTTPLDDSFASLPVFWSKRLMDEVSCVDKVRDSTLRRSTGYALAFLSIMRPEQPSSVAPIVLCPDILATLIRLSLPSGKDLDGYLQQIGFTLDSGRLFLSTDAIRPSRLPDGTGGDEKWRTRVHALNILRLAVLDAPLASATRPFMSDAMISSLIAYGDPSWAVRNSATMVFAAVMLRVVDADKNASSSGGNAITATELFRSYPVLPRFLLCLAKKEVNDMQVRSVPSTRGSLDSTSGPGHPSLYPILLLLARLQSVAKSGENTAHATESFIPSVFLCLNHRHHKIRLAAARAMANISSDDPCRESFGEELIAKCEDFLVRCESQKHKDWNGIHGALLGIHHLLRVMSDPWSFLRRNDDLHARLMVYTELDGDICPPPCASISLETLNYVAGQSPRNEPIFKEQLAKAAIVLVSTLNRLDDTSPLTARIGEAGLAAIASRAYCDCGLGYVLDPSVSVEKQIVVLDNLTFLVESSVIDVRLEAVKALKKTICCKIDELLSRSDVTGETKRDTILRVVGRLQKALLVELDRTCNDGAHPPTVRRLSRCILECCYALQALDFVLETKTESSGTFAACRIWDVSLRMMGMDAEETDRSVVLLDTDKLVNGNALELMAFSLQAWAPSAAEYGSEVILFAQLLKRFNDVNASWRLRHSVAVAIETSTIVPLNAASNAVKESQLEIVNVLLALLQDSDPDVRFVAGRAMLLEKDEDEDKSFRPSFSSQLMLANGYMLIQKRFRGGEMNSRLLCSLLVSCRGIVDRIAMFESEVVHSETMSSPHELMNTGTDREIFEVELANSFEETLLANQLRTASAVKSFALLDPEDSGLHELLGLCSTVMGTLLTRELAQHERDRTPDVAHELTRCPNIFPSLHSLIVGSTAAIYLGAEDSSDVKGDASRIISLLKSERESAVHPCVRKALETLASATPRDTSTHQGLLSCCFLLHAN